MGIANHRADIIRIEALEKHSNADALSIVRIGGYQIVVRTDSWKVGDLAVYIQPDSIVPATKPFEFLWANMTFPDGIVPEKRRRVTARRFRGEWSEGLLVNVSELEEFNPPAGQLPLVGTDVAELLGIYHYEPPEDPQQTTGDNESAPGTRQSRRFPRSFMGWVRFILSLFKDTGGTNTKAPADFRPVYDVEALKNYADVVQEGELVVATEKIHGSNARYTFADGKMYAGSRKLWKAATSPCIWRRVLAQHPWIEEWCRANPDYTLYGEVVPTQGGYNYGCKDGETKFFVFDILRPDGTWEQPWKEYGCMTGPYIGSNQTSCSIPIEHWVPALCADAYTPHILALADGQSTVEGATHIREGIVIRPIVDRQARNLGRVQLKVVSNAFLEKDNK